MQDNLTIQLSEHTFSVLSRAALAAGKTPAELAATIVENTCVKERLKSCDADAANREFEQCFGTLDMGRPIGIDNAEIDADLGRVYGLGL